MWSTAIHKSLQKVEAKCALCQENHPANYKGCAVYKELVTTTNTLPGNYLRPPPSPKKLNSHSPNGMYKQNMIQKNEKLRMQT